MQDEARGDVAVHGFWKRATTCIFDVRVSHCDAPTYCNKKSAGVLERQELAKKTKYLDRCLEMRRHFTPLVYSTDRMAGEEAVAAEKRMASHLAWKLKREYSEMVGYVHARMYLVVVRSNTLLLRGARARRGRIRRCGPQFEDGAGISLQQPYQGC